MIVKPNCAHTTLGLAGISAFFLFLFCYWNLYPQFREIRRVELSSHDVRREKWIQTAMNTTIDGDYNPVGLQTLCAKTSWQEGLIVSCDKIDGGVGNVRNILLNCIRYAIEAGGEYWDLSGESQAQYGFPATDLSLGSLIMPKLAARNQYNIEKIATNNLADFGSFFDHNHFVTTMARDCPQMTIHESLDKLWDVPSLAGGINLDPHALLHNHKHRYMILHPQDWRGAFDRWIRESMKQPQFAPINHEFSLKTPIRVNMHKSLFTFPISYDPPEFVNNFGRLLRFRPDVHRLAAHVLLGLSDRFNLTIDPSKGIVAEKFMGAHLRTDSDAAKAHWRGYDFQKDHFIRQALSENIQIMYVASGDIDATQQLRSLARAQYGIHVVTKSDLLAGPELERMKALSWDQQGLIDYEVLLKSSSFGGIDQSSFAWNLALRRQLVSKVDREDALNSSDPMMSWTLVDELSTIYGEKGSWAWFADSMWP